MYSPSQLFLSTAHILKRLCFSIWTKISKVRYLAWYYQVNRCGCDTSVKRFLTKKMRYQYCSCKLIILCHDATYGKPFEFVRWEIFCWNSRLVYISMHSCKLNSIMIPIEPRECEYLLHRISYLSSLQLKLLIKERIHKQNSLPPLLYEGSFQVCRHIIKKLVSQAPISFSSVIRSDIK